MATGSHYDAKATTERLSDDVKIASTTLEAGNTDGHRRLVAPPLVAAMSAEERVEAEKRLRKKIDTRLLPMIILMYIMSESHLRMGGRRIEK
jgi:hypothetical protein